MNSVLLPDFKQTTLTRNQSAKDIVKGIGRAVTDSRQAAEVLKKKFADTDPVRSCEKIFDFLKDPKNIEYIRESAKGQTVKTLPRMIYDKIGDCKHYATFAESICSSLGIPSFVRLVSQKANDKEPTHIYDVAFIKGKEYVIDPCMDYFNQECHYYYKCDLKQRNMSLKYLSGEGIGKSKHHQGLKNFGKKLKGGLKKTDEQLKKNAQHVIEQQKKDLEKAGKSVKRFANRIAVIDKKIAAKSFLKFIATNGQGFATRLKEEYRKDPQGLKDFWKKWGAGLSWDYLRDAINTGSKTGAKISGMGDDGGEASGSGSGSGDQASQYEAGAKESVGIIKQLIEWFKARKAKKKGDDEVVQRMADSVNTDPTIPKVDNNGDPVPAVPPEQTASVPNELPPANPNAYKNRFHEAEDHGTTTNPKTNANTDTSDVPTNGSFGLSEINSIATFLHWFRGIMALILGFSIIHLPAAAQDIVIIGSFIYLIRKHIYNAYRSRIKKRAAERSKEQ